MTKIEEVILQNQLILLKSVRTLMNIDVETKQELLNRIIVTDTVLKLKNEINK